MSFIIGGTYRSGVVLSNPTTQNPTTVAATGYVTNITTAYGGDAIFGTGAAAWAVTNLGTVQAPHGNGVELAAGGNITNGANGAVGALIGGLYSGISVETQAATVTNFATIAGTGTSSNGVLLLGGGTVVNQQSGLIKAQAVAGRPGAGVSIGQTTGVGAVINDGTIVVTGAGYTTGLYLGAGGSVGNSGTIGATDGSNGVAVNLALGGTLTNLSSGVLIASADAVIVGSGVATVGNSGAISGGNDGVVLKSASTLSNSGTITGTISYGVYLYAGGGATNNAGGLIQGGSAGVIVTHTAGTVVNFGTIAGTGPNGNGVDLLTAGSTVVNYGMLTGTAAAFSFGNGNDLLVVEPGAVFAAPIARLQPLETIDLVNTPADGIVFSGGTLSVQNGGITVRTLILSGYFTTDEFLLAPDGKGGTDITLRQPTQPIIGGVYRDTVVLGNAALGNTATVTSSGIVAAAFGNGIRAVTGQAGNLTNAGTITATETPSNAALSAGDGVYLNAGGSVTNTSSGTSGGYISGASIAVLVGGGTGEISNAGTIKGGRGVVIANDGTATVSNTGTIMGTAGTAVSLGGGNNRLILAPGALFHGMVDGGGGKSVVEVAAAGPGMAGADDGTAATTAYISLGGVTNFSALQVDFSAAVDAGGNLIFDTLVNQGQINLAAGDSLVVGTVANAANGGTIDLRSGGSVHFTGAVAAGQTLLFRPPGGSVLLDHPEQFAAAMTQFDMTDTIDLPLGQATFQQYAGGVLSLSYGGGTVALQLTTISATPQFIFTGDGHGGTDITVNDTTCFCRGTHILTDRGEVAVEDLAVGDRVRTLSGAVKPIQWIGIGRGLVTRKNRLARPIIVRRGALADNVPHRDLYLTHGHALYFASEQVLIPVEHLVNHRSILWDEADRVVEYYHIELEDHDVLLAEGAPAESYYDADNRALFHNTRPGSQPGAATTTFAPIQNGGDLVESVWARLHARAGGKPGGKPEREPTADPDLHLVVDHERIDPAALGYGVYRFAVARPPVDRILLRSRCGVPSLLGSGRSDHRPLGVAIQKIVWHHAGIASCFDYDQPQLREGGCYQPEDGFCWTDGELHLPGRFFTLLNGAFTLVVHTQPHPEMRYPIAPQFARAA